MFNTFASLLTMVAAVASSPPAASSPTAVAPVKISHGRATVVHIRNFAFMPKTVTIAVGSTLTIVNDDSEAHTATALDKSFDSAGLDTNDSWSHVFTKPGTYAYVCDLHPYMKGVVIVRPAHSKGSL